jgi:RNA ligase
MKIADYLDYVDLANLIERGYVSMRQHKDYPTYYILNYTPHAAHTFMQDEWSDALIKSRGLIIDGDDHNARVVSFGLHKFFNVDDNATFGGKILAFDKMDGSLGIVYRGPDGTISIATRGSFHSDQAEWANRFLDQHPDYVEYFDWFLRAYPESTPHVEIIYKDNQIVLDYEFEDLVYLGYQTPAHWRPSHFGYPGRKAESFVFDSFADLIANIRPNKEGFVIFTASKLYKYKYEKYLELHRAVSNLNPKYIWEQMVKGEIYEFIENLPNEFQDDAEQMYFDLLEKRKQVRREVATAYSVINFHGITRREFAEKAMRFPQIKHLLFKLKDGNTKRFEDDVLKTIKP